MLLLAFCKNAETRLVCSSLQILAVQNIRENKIRFVQIRDSFWGVCSQEKDNDNSREFKEGVLIFQARRMPGRPGRIAAANV